MAPVASGIADALRKLDELRVQLVDLQQQSLSEEDARVLPTWVDGVAAGTTPHYPEGAVRKSLSHLSVASETAIGLRNSIDKQRRADEASASVRR